MNDKFLKSYHAQPRQVFVQDLRRRLGLHQEKTERVTTFQLRPIALGAVTLLLVLTLALVISPAARAQVQDWVGQVGGVLFTATGDYPGGDEPATIVPSDEMSLEEARAILPFTVDLPAWVPEGYVLENTVNIPYFDDGVGRVSIRWDAPQKARLGLLIEDRSAEESKWIVGPGSIEEVLVNGEPAALVRGGWDSDAKQWHNPEILTLYVQHNDQTYSFSAIEKDISVDDLVRIAESIP
jgi:hypothetical protein